MTDHDESGGGLPPENPHELSKRKALAKKMPKEDRNRQTVLAACQASRKMQERLNRKTHTELRFGLQHTYTALCVAELDPKLMKAVEKEATDRGIPRNAATCTALLFVRTFSRRHLEHATAWQQAMALRGATLKGIAPDQLAEHLKKEGVVKLAKYFLEQAKLKAGTQDGREAHAPETAAAPASVPAKSSLSSTEERNDDGDMVGSGPALAWPDELVSIWDKATRKQQCLKLVVKPDDGETGTVIKACLLPKSKKEGKRHGS